MNSRLAPFLAAGLLLIGLSSPSRADFEIVEIINSAGNGATLLDHPTHIAVDSADNILVTGYISDIVFMLPAGGGTLVEVIDGTGDGTKSLDGPITIFVDAADNFYVPGYSSDNVFMIPAGGGPRSRSWTRPAMGRTAWRGRSALPWIRQATSMWRAPSATTSS